MDTTKRAITIPLDLVSESLRQFYEIKGRVVLKIVSRKGPEDWRMGGQFISRWRPGGSEELELD